MAEVERSVQNGVYSAHAATCKVLDLYFLYIDPILFRIKNSLSVISRFSYVISHDLDIDLV